MGPDGGYRLDAGSELPPLLFDDDQVIAVAVALNATALTGAETGEAALRALTTVRQVLPSRLRHRLDALDFATITDRPGDGPRVLVPTEVLLELSAATRAHEVVRFDYASGAQQDELSATHVVPPRRVEPHGLVTSGGRWYLVAWDLDRDEWRIYRVDRLALRTPRGPRFVPRELPGGDAATFVAARFKGSDTDTSWPCVGTAILGLPARAVIPFAGDGVVEPLGSDRCTIELGSWSWVALAASLLRFDTTVEVLGPAELSRAFDLLAARAEAAGATPPRS